MVINRLIYKNIKQISRIQSDIKDNFIKKSKQVTWIKSEYIDKLDIKPMKIVNDFNHYIKSFGYPLNTNQIKELKEIWYYTKNKRELFRDNLVRSLIKRNVKNIVKRLRFMNNIVGSGTLVYLILQFGITEGIKRFKNNKFISDNPGKNHGGKFSSFSKKFLKYKELTESEKIEVIDKQWDKVKKTKKEHPENENTQLEYYIKRFGDTDLAREKYYERCNTRSLQAFQRRYGEEEGKLKFESCVTQWLKTLDEKPVEEKIRINRLKASQCSSKYKPGGELENINGILYYIKFWDNETEFYKIGITRLTITQRFWMNEKSGFFKYEIIQQYHDTFYNCFLKEQKILKKYDEFRQNIIKNDKLFTTEAFSKNVLEGELLENY